MRYEEEDYEDRINSLPLHQREEFQPDGMNAPSDPCSHERRKPVPGTLDLDICLACGAFLRPGPGKP